MYRVVHPFFCVGVYIMEDAPEILRFCSFASLIETLFCSFRKRYGWMT